jgi:iron complex transport system substrate-binding protein
MSKTVRKTTIHAILLVLAVCLALTACAPGKSNATEGTQTGEWPVYVENASGETVEIKKKPQSIVATNVWAGEIILDLVDTERISGLSAWGDDPVISSTSETAQAVETRVNTQEPEGIIAVQPDLVLIDTFSDSDGALTRTLTNAGITVLQLASPTSFEQIKSVIKTIAKAVGEVQAGNDLVSQMDEVLDSVESKWSGVPESERLTVMYYEDYYDPSGSSAGMLAAYGKDSPFDAIAQAAGLINVCDVQNYSAVSKEKVVGEWKPDVLVVPAITYGEDFKAVDDKGSSVISAIKEDALMQSLPAVEQDRVFALTERYRGSTSHYMVYAVEELARLAYPDLFS